MKSKRGQLQQLGSLAVGIVIIVIAIVVAFIIMSQGKKQIGEIEGLAENITTDINECQKSIGCNATTVLQTSVDDIPDWMPIVIITMIGSILLGMVVVFAKMHS